MNISGGPAVLVRVIFKVVSPEVLSISVLVVDRTPLSSHSKPVILRVFKLTVKLLLSVAR
uniref:Uncharacterized protein n=1 Tax=viral metagenome TaxID=1070528 RepID=A0A6C0F7N1_9ZZZZ